MSVRFYKAYTSGTRNRSVSLFDEITKKKSENKLTFFSHSAKGRNQRGVITSRNRGGGHKRLYRRIDFKRDKLGIFSKVVSVEYDPNRNARISLLFYLDGEKRYIIHPNQLSVGEIICSDFNTTIKIGNALPLSKIPLGTDIHNVEFRV